MSYLTKDQADTLYALIAHQHLHSTLSGLNNDDHTHYLNNARHDLFARHGNTAVDHGLIAGLLDDDHPHYLTTTRHDSFSRHGAGVVDHGSIGGLGDDDHLQYFNQARGDARYVQLGVAGFTGLIKPADESRFNTASILGDTDLVVALPANCLAVIKGRIYYFSPNGGGIRWRFRMNGSQYERVNRYRYYSHNSVEGNILDVDKMSRGNVTPTVLEVTTEDRWGCVEFSVVIRQAGTAGVFDFQWAQNVSNATAADVFASSYFEHSVRS